MGASLAILLYHNLLFAEGLESMLLKSDLAVLKSELKLNMDRKTVQARFNGYDLILVEANFPFPVFDQISLIHEQFGTKNTKIILVVNVVNQRLISFIKKGIVNGVILKSCDFEELLFAIRQVREGRKYFSSMVANIIMNNGDDSQKIKISKREGQVLALIAEMKSTAQIADKLLISASTVKTHRRNLMSKLHAKNVLCLLRAACRENLLHNEVDYCGCCYRQFATFYN